MSDSNNSDVNETSFLFLFNHSFTFICYMTFRPEEQKTPKKPSFLMVKSNECGATQTDRLPRYQSKILCHVFSILLLYQVGLYPLESRIGGLVCTFPRKVAMKAGQWGKFVKPGNGFLNLDLATR